MVAVVDLGVPTAICTIANLQGSGTISPYLSVEDRTTRPTWTDGVASLGDAPETAVFHALAEPYPTFRYWRLLYTHNLAGFGYYAGFQTLAFMMWSAPTSSSGDDEEDQGTVPGETVESTSDPTVDDDAGDGYVIGQQWVNTATGHVFVLVDATTGAAVWVDVSAGTGVTDGHDRRQRRPVLVRWRRYGGRYGWHPSGDRRGLDRGGDQWRRHRRVRRGTYKIAGALVSTGNFYAQVTLPEIANTAAKQIIILRPKRSSGVTYVNGSQTVVQPGPVVFRSTLAGQTYSGTHGTPSIFGGPTRRRRLRSATSR